MSLPHPALLELAAGRGLPQLDDPWAVLRSAREHRMGGLLWSSQRHLVSHDMEPWQAELRRDDLVARARARRLWAALEEVVRRLHGIGVEVVTVKGVTTEARWYGRLGERPCDDLDVLIRPADLGRVHDIAQALDPDHPLSTFLSRLVCKESVPAITMTFQGVPIDLHFDLMQLGIPLREPAKTLGRTLPFFLADGGEVQVLDPETTLVHLLLNLNKDRFCRLLGYADIARVLQQGDLNWDAIDKMVRAEGLETATYLSLGAVCTTLSLALPVPGASTPRGLRPHLWGFLWRPAVRLQGASGVTRHRHRQHLLAAIARGRGREALRLWWRLVFPARELVCHAYPDDGGPWLWRLTAGRARHAWQRRKRPLLEPVSRPAVPVSRSSRADERRGDALRASSVPVIRPTVVTVELDGETVLLDEETGAAFVLGPAATVTWACFDGFSALGEVADDLAEGFGEDAKQVRADVTALARRLAGYGLLEL